MAEFNFRCKVCNDLRPDSKISVKSCDTSRDHDLPLGTYKQNFQYCNDREECRKVASKWIGYG